MSKYKQLKKDSHQYSSQEKLAILRSEMIAPISTIRGYARLLKKEIDSNASNCVLSNHKNYINNISSAGDELHELLEILTGFKV